MNRMTIIGRSGAAGDVKYLASGTPILELELKDSRRVGETWVTQWFKVVCYGAMATKLAPLIKEGTECVAIGEYERRESKSREGMKRYYEQLNASYLRPVLDLGDVA